MWTNEIQEYIMSNKIILLLLLLVLVFSEQTYPLQQQGQRHPPLFSATGNSNQQGLQSRDDKMTSSAGKYQNGQFMLKQQTKTIITICMVGVVLSVCLLKKICNHSKAIQQKEDPKPQAEPSTKQATQPGCPTSQIDEFPSLDCTIQSIKSKYLIDQTKGEIALIKRSQVVPKIAD